MYVNLCKPKRLVIKYMYVEILINSDLKIDNLKLNYFALSLNSVCIDSCTVQCIDSKHMD